MSGVRSVDGPPERRSPARVHDTHRSLMALPGARCFRRATLETNVHAITSSADLDRLVATSPHPVIVDFGAAWCTPCRALERLLEQVLPAHPELSVVSVDVDAVPELAIRYGVRGVPSLMRFEGGQPVSRQDGLPGRRRLERWLEG